MKRVVPILLLIALLLPLIALGEGEAEDITRHCTVTGSDGSANAARMTDGRITTRWKAFNRGDGWAEITANRDEWLIGAVYVRFNAAPEAWEARVPDGAGWRTVYASTDPFLHDTVVLDEPAHCLRIFCPDAERRLEIAELTVYGPGTLPAGLQHWEPTHEKADILFLAAHADDELIFFGGAIPTYAAERRVRVVVAYLVNCGIERQHELLDGLWSMGVRNYPVIGPFRDRYSTSLDRAMSQMGGTRRVRAWVVSLIRRLRPEVVVTHAWGGEYGHGQHQAASHTAVRAWEFAANPENYRDSAAQYGTWQVKKLYLHLWTENEIVMDWSVPLQSLGGVTGLEAAIRAFEFHVTQHTSGMDVIHTGARYDNTRFGLYASTVGPDLVGGDFLENIDPGADE